MKQVELNEQYIHQSKLPKEIQEAISIIQKYIGEDKLLQEICIEKFNSCEFIDIRMRWLE